MTLRFIVDAQLPPALARFLTDSGYPSEHVHDFAAEAYPDAQLWDRALAMNAVIVTKDEDFAIRSVRDSAPPAIVWVRLGNTRTKRCSTVLFFCCRRLPLLLSGARKSSNLSDHG